MTARCLARLIEGKGEVAISTVIGQLSRCTNVVTKENVDAFYAKFRKPNMPDCCYGGYLGVAPLAALPLLRLVIRNIEATHPR